MISNQITAQVLTGSWDRRYKGKWESIENKGVGFVLTCEEVKARAQEDAMEFCQMPNISSTN